MSDKNDVILIHLDRPRELRFGHKALKTLGALTGKDIDAAMNMEELDLEMVEKVLYCGLISDAKNNNENLQLEDMEDLLDKANPYSEVLIKMQLAMQNAFGAMQAADGEPNAGNQPLQPNRQARRSAGKTV